MKTTTSLIESTADARIQLWLFRSEWPVVLKRAVCRSAGISGNTKVTCVTYDGLTRRGQQRQTGSERPEAAHGWILILRWWHMIINGFIKRGREPAEMQTTFPTDGWAEISDIIELLVCFFPSSAHPSMLSLFSPGPGFEFPALKAVPGHGNYEVTSEELKGWYLTRRKIRRLVIKINTICNANPVGNRWYDQHLHSWFAWLCKQEMKRQSSI